MPPAPVGTPVDIAFGGAVVVLGALALATMGKGFGVGTERRKPRDGIGLPGAPDARKARDDKGNRTSWPPEKKDN